MPFRLRTRKETAMIVQHVLVPINWRATADRALTYAIALAQHLQARLTLLHVLDLTPVTMDDMTAGMTATYLEDLESDAQHLLQASRERVQRAGLQAESLLVQGTPTQTILDTAGEQGVDLIIMGTHGRTPRSRSLVELRDFSSIGVQNGQKCPFQYSNVAVIRLTTPCSVAGHHLSRTLFADLRLPWVSPPLLLGWETALCAGKYPVF